MQRNLKACRQLKKMNQTDVANILNISLHSYCNKENGKVPFTLNEAKKLSNLFGFSIDEIFFTNEVPILSTRAN